MRKFLLMLLILFTVLVFTEVSAYAHTPMLYVEDLKDGTVYLEGGFSDGSSAAGVKIYLVEDSPFSGNTSVRDKYLEEIFKNTPKERNAYIKKLKCEIGVNTEDFNYSDLEPNLFEKKLIIFQSQLDQYGELVLFKPDGKYLIVFDAGPGHVVIKQGPILTETERKDSN